MLARRAARIRCARGGRRARAHDGRRGGAGRRRRRRGRRREPSTPPAPAPSLRVAKLQFRGNRKVEDDAIKVNLKTAAGVTLTQEMLRDDVRAIWKMGYFEDVQVEVTEGKGGSVVTFVLREKPAIKKIYVAGNDEVALSKINEVLDIKKEQILDLAKLKKNVEKIKDLYVEKGFYMAEVTYEVKRDSPSDRRRLVPRPRERQGRGAPGELRRQPRRSPTPSCAT